jgi:hypothetical protein
MDGIDRDHFLDYSAKSKILHFCRNTIQLLRCGPKKRAPTSRCEHRPSPSDPLVGGLPPGQDTDQGLDRRPAKAGPVYRDVSRVVPSSSICGPAGKAGGDEETRTPDPLLAKETLCQLSYVPRPSAWVVVVVVGVSGLEPETSALSGQCSNQLS